MRFRAGNCRRKRLANWAATVFLAMSGVASGAAPWPRVVPVEGQPFAAKIRSIDVLGVASFHLQHGEDKDLKLSELCSWGAWAEAGAEPQIVLVDGSLIVAEVVRLDKDRVALAWGAEGEVSLPLELVAGIVFAPPAEPAQGDLLRAKLLAASGESDRILLANGDELKGEILGLSAAAARTKLDRNMLAIRSGGEEIKIGRDKVSAIVLNPSLAVKPIRANAIAWVGFSDGSRLLVKSLAVDAKEAKLTLALGPDLAMPADDFTALLALGGRTTYLSDLKPASYQQIPYLNLAWPYHADANVLGSMLRGGGLLYLKGLGMHAAARLTYDLPPGYSKFAAEMAIDDNTAGRGSAIFRVYTDDGSGRWQLKYDGPITRGGAPPLPVLVDLQGAKRLSLLIDFADRGDELAHGDWLGGAPASVNAEFTCWSSRQCRRDREVDQEPRLALEPEHRSPHRCGRCDG